MLILQPFNLKWAPKLIQHNTRANAYEFPKCLIYTFLFNHFKVDTEISIYALNMTDQTFIILLLI
jgi:hypothetical protein